MADTNETLRRKVAEQAKQIEEQGKRIEKLSAAMESLERRSIGTPPSPSRHQPIDYTAQFTLPPSAVRDMVAAVPDAMVASIVHDNRSGPVEASAPTKVQRTSGWTEPAPLSGVPGLEQIDAIGETQDAIDKLELMRKLGGKL